MKKSLLVVTLGLALTACSGGGGSSGEKKAENKPMNKAETVKPQNSKTEAAKQPNTSSKDVSKPAPVQQKSIDSVLLHLQSDVKKAKTIEIEGKKLDLSAEPLGFVERDLGKGLKGKMYNQAYSSIGYLLPNNVKTDQYGRVIDERTSNNDAGMFGLATEFRELPASGKAVYNGVASGPNTEGKLYFEADFGNKSVSGKIYDRKLLDSNQKLSDVILQKGVLDKLELAGDISHFRGGVTYNDNNSSTLGGYAGRFYGPNGQEVLGFTGLYAYGTYKIYEGFAGKVNGEMPSGDSIRQAEFKKSQEDLKKELEKDRAEREKILAESNTKIDKALEDLKEELNKPIINDVFDVAAPARRLEPIKVVDFGK